MEKISSQVPFEASYWVVPGVFLAGEYPGGWGELDTRKRIQQLIQCGISACFDLTREGESGLYPYAEIFKEEGSQYLKSIEIHRFPITDFMSPKTETMVQILNQIDSSIQKEKTVYVHCRAGIGRTGTVVGAYLVRHGTDPETVVEVIKHLRKDMSNKNVRSPEADEQIEFIRNWKIGQ